MAGRLRVLWVTPHLPLRGVSAAQERWWNLLERVASRHDVTLLAFTDPEDMEKATQAPSGLGRLDLVPKAPCRPADPLALLPQAAAGGFSHPSFRTSIAAALAREAYDLVQYEYGEMAHCMPWPGPPAILTVHQIGFAQERGRWQAERGGARQAAVLLHRYLRELDFELRAVAQADHVVTMSAEDAARLHRFRADLPISVSPCGVDGTVFRPGAVAPATPVDLLFVGNFGHPPNDDAVRFLVGDVLPRLARPVRFRVVGRSIPAELDRFARAAGVDVAGGVPDVRPHLAAARIVVAPVRFGTGMRGKVLEALAMARPVVTTALGAEGLGARPDCDLVLAETSSDVARAIERLLADPARAEEIGAAGRALVTPRFEWDTVAAAHEAIYERVLREPRRGRPPRPIASPSLAALADRLGYLPGLGLGTGLLALRAIGWHARSRRSPVSA